MSLISYCGGPFEGIDNVAGVMTRSHGMAGQIFEPRTVETAAHVAVRSTSAIPLIVDLEHGSLFGWIPPLALTLVVIQQDIQTH